MAVTSMARSGIRDSGKRNTIGSVPIFIAFSVFAGGGGSGTQLSFLRGAGGGGGGGYRSSLAAPSGRNSAKESDVTGLPGTFALTVGAGGTIGNNGGDSVFGSITALGGGGGGGTDRITGNTGGSGGGGSDNSTGGAGGAGTTAQGFGGGNGASSGSDGGAGGGGGGAFSAGANGGTGSGAPGGVGGAGISFNNETFCAGGTGGGRGSSGPSVAGGANTGNGARGGGSSALTGANGGSGIVFLAIPEGFTASFSLGVSQTSSAGPLGSTLFRVTAAGPTDTVTIG